MLTAMRGELVSDPKLRCVTTHDGKELKVTDATIAYQKDPEGGKTFVRAVGWEQVAEALAKKKQGETIEFAGHLTYDDYQNSTMEKPHKVLSFSVTALDESKTLCQKLEEYMGVQRRPEEQPGAIFQPMRGKLFANPVLTQHPTKDGQPLDICNATLRFWNGKTGEANAFVHVTAYGDVAKELAEMRKDDPIQFVGRLDSRPYTNSKMDFVHMELCYNVHSINKERTLCRDTENFINEQMGLKKVPLKDRLEDADKRKNAPAASQTTPAKETAAPVK